MQYSFRPPAEDVYYELGTLYEAYKALLAEQERKREHLVAIFTGIYCIAFWGLIVWLALEPFGSWH